MKQMKLNDKKIAFIVCSNNELYCSECIWYLERLTVPDGYEREIINIRDALSMAEGYNAAMHESDAKYKVYLHQDVFIFHKNFIKDIIETFQSDSGLGLLGVVGGVDIPSTAVIWCAWNRGKTYVCDNKTGRLLDSHKMIKGSYMEVEAVDGMLMATQYDIEWRNDLGLGWDFYDISQSLEFRRHGLKVGIPRQETAWCMHDCGYSKLKGYDLSRKKILLEYPDYFSGPFIERYKGEQEIEALNGKLTEILKSLIMRGETEYAEEIIKTLNKEQIRNNELQYVMNITELLLAEKKETSLGFTEGLNDWEEVKNKYICIKFIIQYWENDIDKAEIYSLKEMLQKGEISRQAILVIAKHSAYDYKKVEEKLIKLV